MLNQFFCQARLLLVSIILFTPLAAQAVDVQFSQLLDTDPVIRGGDLTYTVSVLNASADTASNVVLTLPLPANTSFVSVDNGSCSHDNGAPGTLICNFGDIAGNGSGGPVTTIQTTIRTSAATGSVVSVEATLSTDSSETNTDNNIRSQNTTVNNGADLVATITDSPDPVAEGGNVTYTISIENLGPDNASVTTVTNELPPEASFVTASGGGWSCSASGQTVTCTRTSLANGDTAPDITIVANVSGISSGNITDNVSVSSTTDDPKTNNNTTTTSTAVGEGTDLLINLSVNPDPVASGSLAEFTLSPENLGPSTAVTATQVVYTLPASFDSSQSVIFTQTGGWACGQAVAVITCTRPDFQPGVSDDIVFTATAPAAGTINSAATISLSGATITDIDLSNNSASLSGNITPPGADLSIAKDKSPDPVVQGATITSTITVTNLGPDPTTGTITITDELSDETYVSSGANWVCAAAGVAPAQTITCTYSGVPLAANDVATPLTITTTATNAGALTNVASVSDVGGTADGVAANNSVSQVITSYGAGQITDLSITKSAITLPDNDTTLSAAENTITYTLTLLNTGNDVTSIGGDDIYITDDIPNYTAGTGIVVTSPDTRFTCGVSADTVFCRLNDTETFASGESATFTIQATRPFAPGITHNNLANVSSSTMGDPDLSNNTSNTTSITVDDSVQISDVEMTGKTILPDPVKVGTNATYVLSFRNNGPNTATGVTVQDVFSPPVGRNFTVISATPSGAGSCSPFNSATNTLDCSIGTMTPNQAETVTIVIRPDSNDTWSMNNTATISAATNNSVTTNDSKTATLNVIPAEIDLLVEDTDLTDPITYTATPGAFPGTLDNIIVYKIEMTNDGPSRATDVTLENVMTPKSGKTITFLCDDAGAASCAVGTSTCNNTNTAVTGPASLTLSCPQTSIMDVNTGTPLIRYLFFRVDTVPDAGNDTHFNRSTISANEVETKTTNNTENEDTTVITNINLGITKAPSITTVSIDQSFNWDIVVFKNGTTNAASTTLTDTLPTGMVLTGTPTASQGTCTGVANATSFACNLGTVVRRATSGVADVNDIAITVPVKLTTPPSGGTSTNTAIVEAPTFGSSSASGTVSLSTVNLGITKAPSVTTINVNQDFNWNIVVFKNGPADAPSTTLTDTLPTGMVLTGTPTTDQGTCTGVANDTSFTCNLGTVVHRTVSGTADANDAVISVPVRVTVTPSGGTTTNIATATAPNFGNVSDSGTVTVQAPSNLASVSGKVHDRGNPNNTHAGWTVEIFRNGVLVGTTVTDTNSGYSFEGLQPGPGYEIFFRHPESNAVFGVIRDITLTANTVLPNQNFPLDPSGVVYNSITRQPVPGAIVTFSGPPGFDPDTDLIGGAGNISQTVGSDGMYKYLLNPIAPAGTYSLSVLQPAGYILPNSLNIPAPCDDVQDGNNLPLTIGAAPDPANIQPQVIAPPTTVPLHDPAVCPALGISGTQYYLRFNLNSNSADVLNNHIPLDPEGSGLGVVKTTPKANVVRGDLVPYTVRVTNNTARPIASLRIQDQMPPGFKYVANSAILDGALSEPVANGRLLTWPVQSYAVGESHEVKMLMVIGAGVGEGEYINQAWGINAQGGRSTIVTDATVRIVPDPTFDCTDLIGKVFDDKNTNGYQDEGESGLPGVRVATARGLVITSDPYGRYHVPCAAVPNEMRGSNFIMKLDEQSLPSGYRVTTENPRVIRITRGKLAKLNFGAAIHRVVRLDLNTNFFDQNSDEIRADHETQMHKLLDVLGNEPSVLHIAYAADGESKIQIQQRLINFRNHLKSMWGGCDCNHELIIEEEILWEPMATRGSVSTGRAPK